MAELGWWAVDGSRGFVLCNPHDTHIRDWWMESQQYHRFWRPPHVHGPKLPTRCAPGHTSTRHSTISEGPTHCYRPNSTLPTASPPPCVCLACLALAAVQAKGEPGRHPAARLRALLAARPRWPQLASGRALAVFRVAPSTPAT